MIHILNAMKLESFAVGPPHLPIWRADCPRPFYIKDMNICRFGSAGLLEPTPLRHQGTTVLHLQKSLLPLRAKGQNI